MNILYSMYTGITFSAFHPDKDHTQEPRKPILSLSIGMKRPPSCSCIEIWKDLQARFDCFFHLQTQSRDCVPMLMDNHRSCSTPCRSQCLSLQCVAPPSFRMIAGSVNQQRGYIYRPRTQRAQNAHAAKAAFNLSPVSWTACIPVASPWWLPLLLQSFATIG